MSNLKRISDIEIRLEEIDKERRNLAAELSHLRTKQTPQEEMPALIGATTALAPQNPDQKIELFLGLFQARSSVYPKLWENSQKGTKGYSPACRNEWVKELCGKPKIKCTDCPNQAFLKLDSQAVRDHLQGKHTIGTYAICEDDSCRFLAADFDGKGWAADVLAYKSAGRELGIQIEIERSRSGNGAHAWIFFLDSLPSRLARQLGTIIIARAQASRHAMSLETYDRFFPNQDYLPKGGFGNLIALPLQKAPREKNNSIFLDEKLEPVQDQWGHLAQIRRLSWANVQQILNQQTQENSDQLIHFEDIAVASAEKALDAGRRKVIAGCYPGNIEIQCGAQLSIKLDRLPSEIIAAFKRTATFANPKFFELERMRFSTWKTPRFIFCGELQPDHLILPRGSLDTCLEIAKKAGSSVVLSDLKPQFKKLKVSFSGELSSSQKKAVAQICTQEIGVLVAPPGAGKTVMGCNIIAKRKVSTLILVHRMPLLEQWKMQISTFLGIEIKKIGTLGGQKKKQTGEIDIGMLQTLANLEDPEEALAGYGQIIIDECHHIPAVSFEAILKKCSPRYVLGLTATPYRKDGHQAIIHMQCGPVRHEIKHVDGPILNKKVIVRETTFKMPEELGQQPAIHLVWENLVVDRARLDLVAQDLRNSLMEKRFPLIISERKEHLEMLAQVFKEKLSDLNARAFTLTGGLGKKTRAAILNDLNSTLKTETRPYILATGSFIGEGFDMPELDTLIIAMPVSFKGKLIQYAGRLHRVSAEKKDVIIYDYLDSSSALTVSMFRKRLAAYKTMGYQIHAPPNSRANRMISNQGQLL
ncbi:MAG: TOTE conflict system archaeo-eukaryotic primase domain-containing protein [Bdellovibrionales bacterium]